MTEHDSRRRADGEPSAPQPASYLSSDRHDAVEPVDDVVGLVMERFGGAEAMRGAELMRRWTEFAGEWAQRATPVAVRDGVLTLEVSSGGEAVLLRYDEGAIRARIQRDFGRGIVRSIKVRVARDGHR